MTKGHLGWLGAVALLSSGCASITAGFDGTQRLHLATDPPGATATAGDRRCTTPCSLALPRREDASVTLQGPGLAPQEVRLRSRLRIAAAADAIYPPLLLPLLGVDLATGTAWELVPPDVQVKLEPADPVAPSAPRPPLTPAPRPERAATLTLELGGASTSGTTLFGVGGVLTVPVHGPFVLGAELFHGETFDIFRDGKGGGVYGLLGGLEASGDSGRAALLLRLAVGHGSPRSAESRTVTLPQVALRGEASLLAADTFVLGLWATAGLELSRRTVSNPGGPEARVGGRVFGAGLNLGFAIPRSALARRSGPGPASDDGPAPAVLR